MNPPPRSKENLERKDQKVTTTLSDSHSGVAQSIGYGIHCLGFEFSLSHFFIWATFLTSLSQFLRLYTEMHLATAL